MNNLTGVSNRYGRIMISLTENDKTIGYLLMQGITILPFIAMMVILFGLVKYIYRSLRD